MTWTIVLASGEGTRLAEETRRRFGYVRPNQYCDFDGTGTLLDRTLERAAQLSPYNRIAVVTARAHRQDADHVLLGHPGVLRVEQPRGRDTAPALIQALLMALATDPSDDVIVLPCDHHVVDESVFIEATRHAVASVRNEPSRIAVLGAVPNGPVDGYGWIVPDPDAEGDVMTFCEKPTSTEAEALRDEGALVNTLVFAARTKTLAAVLTRFCPGWWRVLGDARAAVDRLDAAFDVLPDASFSRDVLAHIPHMLRLVPVARGAGWSDIGTPDRLALALGATSEM